MATAFRALVMLSVLVGLPAAWIYYGPLPPAAQQVVNRLVTVAKEAAGWEPREDKAPTVEEWTLAKSHAAASTAATTGAGEAAGGVAQTEAPPLMSSELVEQKSLTFAEQMEPLLARLRQFGAAGYALERWGVGGNLYRFHCEMPLGSSAEVTQQFEAIAADPQSSVEQVVAEIADWQLARRRGGM